MPVVLSRLALSVAVSAAAVAPVAAQAQWVEPPRLGYEVVKVYPHDRGAFTQGLIFRDGHLYESTGLNGRSSLRKVELETGKVLQQVDVDRAYFAEGLTDWGDRLLQLTWQSGKAFVYERASLKQVATRAYAGEGWGLTQDGKRLILSDGTPVLRFLDPETFAETGRISVTYAGRPLANLNELEYVKGEIFANVWQTHSIVVIDPASGQVTRRIDLPDLLDAGDRRQPVDVLNGIAYDARKDRLFVTGKLWPKLFEIRLKPFDPPSG